MYKKNIKSKHYSLGYTFALFIIIMSTLLIASMLTINNRGSQNLHIDYGTLSAINPLILESSNNVQDKTDINIELASEIKRVYNLDVIYGEGTESLAKSVDATSLYDSQNINKLLLELIECLEKYPNNIFKEIELKDYTIEICLVDTFHNDNLALATRDSNNNFKIYLSNSDKIEKVKRSVHHETYHILEYYMKLEYDINKLYKDWNMYNPEGFIYNDDITLLDTKYVYNLDESSGVYFVTPYSKVSDKEDRAEVFADTMISDKKPLYYTDSIGAIKGKMQLITDVLQECFYSVEYGTSIYWTRYF